MRVDSAVNRFIEFKNRVAELIPDDDRIVDNGSLNKVFDVGFSEFSNCFAFYILLGNCIELGFGPIHQHDDALRCYIQALEIEPFAVDAYRAIGFYYFTRGEKAASIEAFEISQALDPTAEVQDKLAELLERKE